jgi:hypothetical protein
MLRKLGLRVLAATVPMATGCVLGLPLRPGLFTSSRAAEGATMITSNEWVVIQPPEENGKKEKDGSGKNGENGQKGGNGDKEKNGKGPEHMRDNAILVEEASNQEAGVVQHITVWGNFWDWAPGVRTREFAMSYTMELPVGSQKHQFSFTIPYLTNFEKPDDGPAQQQGDIGDIFLNYRYQLLADDDFLWVAPRFSLILPTGDERLGLGTGQVGYQFNLPISRYGENFDFHFNAGFTFIPDVRQPLSSGQFSQGHDLRGYNLGVSAYWKPETYLHFYVEALALWNDEIQELVVIAPIGTRNNVTQVLLNPGFRWAVCQFDEVEWVLGAAVPIGLTKDTPDIGVFAYMSVEHKFRKVNGNGNGSGNCHCK